MAFVSTDLAALLDAPAWHQLALCAQIGGDIWFPDIGSPGKEAKRICRRCEVQAECLAADPYGDEYGIWAGLSQAERQARERQVAA